jgi:hypothetical protein
MDAYGRTETPARAKPSRHPVAPPYLVLHMVRSRITGVSLGASVRLQWKRFQTRVHEDGKTEHCSSVGAVDIASWRSPEAFTKQEMN